MVGWVFTQVFFFERRQWKLDFHTSNWKKHRSIKIATALTQPQSREVSFIWSGGTTELPVQREGALPKLCFDLWPLKQT